MADNNSPSFNKPYFFVVILLTVFLPLISAVVESHMGNGQFYSIAMAGKWFIFWAVGIRLFMAGIRQVINPAFTAKEIFHIEDRSSYIIVRELGYANLCFGLVGIISLFIPSWRMVSAFASGLYYGLAAVSHFIKKLAGPNETIALVSDVFIFLALLAFVLLTIYP